MFGGAFHSALQHHYEQLLIGNRAPDRDTLLDVFWESWRQYADRDIQFPATESIDSIGQLADRTLLAFQASSMAQLTGTIIGVEKELRGVLVPGCPDLLARVDLIVETDNELVVTDFKTARRSWSDAQVNDAATRLLIYHELARPLSDGKPLRLQFAVMSKPRHRLSRSTRSIRTSSRSIAPSVSSSGFGTPFRQSISIQTRPR